MTGLEVLRLLDAGYTKDEIAALEEPKEDLKEESKEDLKEEPKEEPKHRWKWAASSRIWESQLRQSPKPLDSTKRRSKRYRHAFRHIGFRPRQRPSGRIFVLRRKACAGT